jgi:hypothetical protein
MKQKIQDVLKNGVFQGIDKMLQSLQIDAKSQQRHAAGSRYERSASYKKSLFIIYI